MAGKFSVFDVDKMRMQQAFCEVAYMINQLFYGTL